MRFFTHYWRHAVASDRIDETSDAPLVYFADTRFGQRGVQVGDELYALTIAQRQLVLIGKLVAGRLTADSVEATSLLGRVPDDLAPGLIYAFAARATPMSAARIVPEGTIGKLRFRTRTGSDRPKTRADGTLEPQTLRTPRELDPEAAAALDALLPPLILVTLPIPPVAGG